jgi:polysaccharide deacetylase family protein (PEP-CTERM system associated)
MDEPVNRSVARNAMSVDVEDYFMVSAFERFVPKDRWEACESRVVRNTEKVLSLLQERDVRATFFVLGWVGERYPGLVGKIRSQGHEVACHGYDHRLVYNQTPQEFRRDVRTAKRILEEASGGAVVGYRAPSFSIVEETRWALEILSEEGFHYDASVLPGVHARGGMPGADRFPGRIGGLREFPMSTLHLAGLNFPFSGGGYFRLLPYRFIRWGIGACHRQGQSAIVYVHPWEFDPAQPRFRVGALAGFKHYVNLHKTEEKFRRLLSEFRFGTVRDVLADALAASENPAPSPT